MSTRFEILGTPLDDVRLLVRKPLCDSRGYFERLFCGEELGLILSGQSIVQVNHTYTTQRGTVRGLHFQHPPHTETKFVSCLRGEVFDVVVDLRQKSSTFLHWHAEILSADNHKTLVIPEGCAHGFQTLTDDCEMFYLHTADYKAEAESGLNVLDPRLAIAWPLAVDGLSPRDKGHAMLDDGFQGITP